KFCPHCGEPFDFDRVYVGHLGHYRCPTGGFVRPHLDLRATRVEFQHLEGQLITLAGLDLDGVRLAVPLSGLYNTYNILAAVAAASCAGVPGAVIPTALSEAQPSFGRLEQVDVDGVKLRMMLAKNPAGFNEVLRASRELGDGRFFLLAINDR